MEGQKDTVRSLTKGNRIIRERAEEILALSEYRRQGGKKGAKMAKKAVTVDLAILKNTKVKGALLAVAFVVVALVASSLGDSAGYKRGFEAGDKNGFANGDKAGFENGYWLGREEGCEWVISSSGKDFIVGIGNPFSTYYFLMDLGSTYIERDNCSTEGHGDAPYESSPYSSGVEGTN